MDLPKTTAFVSGPTADWENTSPTSSPAGLPASNTATRAPTSPPHAPPRPTASTGTW